MRGAVPWSAMLRRVFTALLILILIARPFEARRAGNFDIVMHIVFPYTRTQQGRTQDSSVGWAVGKASCPPQAQGSREGPGN